jgi:hypothetical protein
MAEPYKFPDEVEDNTIEVVTDESDIEVEIVEDTPERDRGRKPLDREVSDPTDEEIESYSDNVKKRIKDLTHARHDERRAKEALLREKEELERLSLELSNLIADGPQKPDPQKELPFAADSGDKPNWDLTPITDALKMTAKQREKLEEIGIKTVGQFEFLRAGRDPVYPDGLRSIKGFGAATVDAFENDIVNWLQANRRQHDPDEGGGDGE